MTKSTVNVSPSQATEAEVNRSPDRLVGQDCLRSEVDSFDFSRSPYNAYNEPWPSDGDDDDFEFHPTPEDYQAVAEGNDDFHFEDIPPVGLTFAELIDIQGDYYKTHGTDFGDFLAARLHDLASQARFLCASSPLDFIQREADALASMKGGE